ncbi:hypothetical protein EMIHUDRAFT_446661 [Emiliania huxleyi CCMP1516]|uniref:Uncharacterized protein n=2 Tax=Emiliania huxleyi TaxID=2903 RepID=A0A0D3HZL0_EMIH1|nr:hypothetical protein EMIHUDRAFT_446661 [Emiliania huxleyi CCMP1516]EOD04445.1 hypothetical protein EMIHUDRAFT_446661 [Emiliania huxleyi CCMP1516]|eukprot:XP_005756874.1 hypothetical protein EMIHUDRAFT_446661 [Emiliania huxleyi CCMP1516]
MGLAEGRFSAVTVPWSRPACSQPCRWWTMPASRPASCSGRAPFLRAEVAAAIRTAPRHPRHPRRKEQRAPVEAKIVDIASALSTACLGSQRATWAVQGGWAAPLPRCAKPRGSGRPSRVAEGAGRTPDPAAGRRTSPAPRFWAPQAPPAGPSGASW